MQNFHAVSVDVDSQVAKADVKAEETMVSWLDASNHITITLVKMSEWRCVGGCEWQTVSVLSLASFFQRFHLPSASLSLAYPVVPCFVLLSSTLDVLLMSNECMAVDIICPAQPPIVYSCAYDLCVLLSYTFATFAMTSFWIPVIVTEFSKKYNNSQLLKLASILKLIESGF